MLGLYVKVVICCGVFSVGCGMGTQPLEGFPVGFASDCPGSEKKSVISKENLKRLSFLIMGEGGFLTSRRKYYNYYQMENLIRDPDLDLNKKTMIYVSGYLDSPSFPFGAMLMKAYKDVGYNTMMLDTHFFTIRQYPIACRYMRPVGLHTAEMLVTMTNLGLDPKKIELVGLSLGAHTASFIANNFRDMTGINITRITGLDPAGPCFRNLGLDERLDASDADFVDFIGTNIDGMGSATPVGHVNFYANGGENQPGDFDVWLMCQTFCSHTRSLTLWLSAVQHPDKFIGIKCDNVQQARESNCYDRVPVETNVMGLTTNKNNTGIFYLATDHKYPYFMGKKGIKKEYEFWTNRLSEFNEEDLIKL